MRSAWLLIAPALAACLTPGWAQAGRIFVSGHDPEWHAHFGRNREGSIDVGRTAIQFVRGGSAKPFLYI
jgi:hypothetical protein